MLVSPRYKPVVFGGPSIELAEEKYGHKFDFRGPIRRGDLEALMNERRHSGCVLITDGVFGQTLSVSPIECLRMIKNGWLLIGASSMGALRAADCNTAGMVGVGHVYMGYQLGYFKSDADVAVLYAGPRDDEATISYVHAEYVGRLIQKTHILASSDHRRFLHSLRQLPWYERAQELVAYKFASAHKCEDLAELFLDICSKSECHPKKLDALLACDYIWNLYMKRG